MAIQITDNNFNELLASTKPLIVDFWAEWCAPCRMIAPIIEELASEYKERVIIGKVNVDQNEELSSKYNIRSIPTLLFFKNGELVDKQIGGTSKNDIEVKIKTLL
ncbi:thioredoxin [Candidatus Azobacteroides pseudotrichonymphae]|jgi:thioredoxin 1|uniref:Thioredoxin n=1 Tax=Azobacteroides pseudotrichonymphae genomovar. CFP2 TaxID=511995 RepID=B6YQZ1_AZOPC|nr:thioredoxin [Candidatus Azobacteroides pseudotrichonymphae]MDR0529987.1 thioredoxin [Bacteroidales bacterium OttesenSCG-928-I14]BAG83613.1 thioredoxin [Candidatus Azobacteroides pseudotrichonymphae genomovar. CFP2]